MIDGPLYENTGADYERCDRKLDRHCSSDNLEQYPLLTESCINPWVVLFIVTSPGMPAPWMSIK